MLFAGKREEQRLSHSRSDFRARSSSLLLALPWVSPSMAAMAGLVCGIGLALAIPRVGAWSLVLMLPLCVGAGFIWGHRARAAESRDALEQLKSRLAHELNNPLAILIDQLDSAVIALERTSLPQSVRRAPDLKLLADEALAAATRIARVVRELDGTTPLVLDRPVAARASTIEARGGRSNEREMSGRMHTERTVVSRSGSVPKPARARILVIDDEPQVAASLRRMLYRHDVTVATSGFEAQSLIQHHEFDVIVSDVMMPEPSGMDVFERLTRTDPDLARRFVFVTGGTYTSQARDFLASIPNARLGKPVDALALDRAIAEIHQGFERSAVSTDVHA